MSAENHNTMSRNDMSNIRPDNRKKSNTALDDNYGDGEFVADDYITQEEREYFAKAIKQHLPGSPQAVNPVISQAKVLSRDPSKYPAAKVRAAKPSFIANSAIKVDLQKDPHADDEFKRPGLQTSIMSKLASGKFRPEESLDLHGMKVTEAGEELTDFMNNAYQAGTECVIVIHGKGSVADYNSTTGARPGKLKSYVIEWLKNNDMILGFCRALTQDGGSGATYILLSK